jgi:hypothetical protein
LCNDNKKKKSKDSTKLQIKQEIYDIVEDKDFWESISTFVQYLNPVKIAIKVCESKTLYIADTVYIFAVLGVHVMEQHKKISSISSLFKVYSVYRFLHRWGELLEIESGFSLLCYILHPAYKMKGVNSTSLHESKTLETVVKDDHSFIIIPSLIKIAAIYWQRMGKSIEQCKSLIHELRIYDVGEGDYGSAYDSSLGTTSLVVAETRQ